MFAGLWMAGFASLVGVFGYQVYSYLRHGGWVGMSVTTVCGSPPFEWSWCNFPSTWLGLHEILSFLNVGAFAFLVATAAVAIAASTSD